MENTTDQTAQRSNSERIHRIHKRVMEVRQNEKAGVKYMLAWEERYYDREEARKEAREANTLENIRNLMETLKLTAEQAMDALKVSKEDQKKYLDILKG
ncbi:MAG: hypothetical protein LIO86_06390 [Lachnospiraceae bacterium]|nr:hypothetical protein [Lachnospiraceae bacterium]